MDGRRIRNVVLIVVGLVALVAMTTAGGESDKVKLEADPSTVAVGEASVVTLLRIPEEFSCACEADWERAPDDWAPEWSVSPAKGATLKRSGSTTATFVASVPGRFAVTVVIGASETYSATITVSDDPAAESPSASAAPVAVSALRFSNIEGQGLAYHMDPVYKTPISLGEAGDDSFAQPAWAKATYDFSEPAGVQTMKGTDTITFEGTFDPSTGRLTGTYVYKMDAVSTGGDAEPILHMARLKGKIHAEVPPGGDGTVLEGALTGSYSVGSAEKRADLAPDPTAANWTFTLTAE